MQIPDAFGAYPLSTGVTSHYTRILEEPKKEQSAGDRGNGNEVRVVLSKIVRQIPIAGVANKIKWGQW